MSRHYRTPAPAQLYPENGSLVFVSPYDPGLVAAIKSQIPASERKFDPNRKAWIVAPVYGDLLATMTLMYLDQTITVPQVQTSTVTEIKIITVKYIGRTKERPGFDSRTSLALDDRGDWYAIFPEDILITWFTGLANIQAATTLYGILGITRGASVDEIKASYRRLARQWHPDVCKEPDAHEHFIKLQQAYELLNNSNTRARYDAGLALEESIKTRTPAPIFGQDMSNGYRPPLRCGYVCCEGIEKVGRFNVSKILNWEDITDLRGRTLVTSWPLGADHPVESWV